MANYVTVNKQRFKYAKRINGLNNEQIAPLIGYSSDGVDKLTRKTSKGNIDKNAFKILCRVLDVYPSYLTGEYNEPAGEMYKDILSYKKTAFFKKYGNGITENEYAINLAEAKKRVDPDGIYIPSYTRYLSEVSEAFCISRFKNWLFSINADEYIPREFTVFPTNDELSTMLNKMNSSDLREFWESMAHSAYDYMVEHGYHKEFSINDSSDEELGKRFLLKTKDMNKTRLEEI